MRILKKTCLTLLVIIPIYGNSEHHETSEKEIELSVDVTKKEKFLLYARKELNFHLPLTLLRESKKHVLKSMA